MRKLIVLILLSLTMTVAGAGVEKRETAQNIGIGSGVVIGAAIGGPAGAILGAALGGHFADSVHLSGKVPALQNDLDSAHHELDASRDQVARLNRSLFETRSELGKLGEEMSGLLLERAAFEGLQMEVLYPTGASTLTDNASSRLVKLAELLQKLPDMTVRLDGYADPRGDETYNDSLSRQRAESVRDALIAAGVDMDRIAVHAHGESAAAAGDNLDAYALERKVRVRLFGSIEGAQVAQEN